MCSYYGDNYLNKNDFNFNFDFNTPYLNEYFINCCKKDKTLNPYKYISIVQNFNDNKAKSIKKCFKTFCENHLFDENDTKIINIYLSKHFKL